MLHAQLADYAPLLTCVENGRVTRGPVQVVISGQRPIEAIRNQSLHYTGYDGRLDDLNSVVPAHLMPLISDIAKRHFDWQAGRPVFAADQQRLRECARRAPMPTAASCASGPRRTARRPGNRSTMPRAT